MGLGPFLFWIQVKVGPYTNHIDVLHGLIDVLHGLLRPKPSKLVSTETCTHLHSPTKIPTLTPCVAIDSSLLDRVLDTRTTMKTLPSADLCISKIWPLNNLTRAITSHPVSGLASTCHYTTSRAAHAPKNSDNVMLKSLCHVSDTQACHINNHASPILVRATP